MDQVTYSKMLINNGITIRYKFDIIKDARHFGFVHFFALVSDRDNVAKPRADIAQLLREGHTAAWQRYHANMNV